MPPQNSVSESLDARDPERPEPEIRVEVSWCKGCGLCVAYCSRGVLELKGSRPVAVRAERCTRCLQCEAICPDFAIEIRAGTGKEPRRR